MVVGGGIAGLSAAHRVRAARPDVEVIVLERAARVGGKLAVAELAGQPVDVGAEAMLARRPEGVELARELGLRIRSPLTTSARVWIGGAARPLPARTVLGVPGDVAAARESGVLSAAALARLEREAEEDHPPLTEDVAVGDLVAARLGDEVVDRLVEPLLGGVYAGRARSLSLRAAIPALARRLSDTGGSLVRAAQASVMSAPVSNAAVFASLPGGLGVLPQALARSLDIRTGCTVRSLRRVPSGFELQIGPTRERTVLTADAVVVAVPPGKAAGLLREVAPLAAGELTGVRSASVAIVSAAFRDVALPAGSGLLVPPSEGRAVKGVTVTSQKWPGAPAGLTLLRASVGRDGDERVLQRDDAELVALVLYELRILLGVAAPPVDTLVTRWGGALPQYEVGHLDRVARIRAAVDGVPGLAVAGAAYDGVGVPACIATGTLAADRILPVLGGR